jgi:hypothetical protein
VLEEVRGAVCFLGLGSGPGVNPHADRGCLGPRRVLGRNLEEVCYALFDDEVIDQQSTIEGSHGQAILEGCGLRAGDVRGSRKASSQGTGG